MGDKASKGLIFLLGTAVGSVATWYYTKRKYEKIADEEIATIRDFYRSKYHPEPVNTEEDDAVKSETDRHDISSKYSAEEVVEYHNIASKYKKDNQLEEEHHEKNEEKGETRMNAPYVISPNDFDSIGYETQSLTLYADGVLTDDMDNPIEDIDCLVGEDSLTHFGEYEDDSVFVRNDDLKTDFEILLDERNFYDDNE